MSDTALTYYYDTLCYYSCVGTLHTGDEIREVNGKNIYGHDVETVQHMLVSDVILLLIGWW